MGDIAISIEMAALQAKEYRLSFEEEFCSLMIHGVLHLLGYDHEKEEKEANIMHKLEKTILKEVKNTFIC